MLHQRSRWTNSFLLWYNIRSVLILTFTKWLPSLRSELVAVPHIQVPWATMFSWSAVEEILRDKMLTNCRNCTRSRGRRWLKVSTDQTANHLVWSRREISDYTSDEELQECKIILSLCEREIRGGLRVLARSIFFVKPAGRSSPLTANTKICLNIINEWGIVRKASRTHPVEALSIQGWRLRRTIMPKITQYASACWQTILPHRHEAFIDLPYGTPTEANKYWI